MATVSAASQTSLQGLRVLVTRPAAQARKWEQRLHAYGAATLTVPLMAIEPLADNSAVQMIKTRVMALAQYQHVIFVSQNAVQYGLQWIDQYWPQLPFGVPFYAVGSATAKGLQAYGCSVTAAGHTMNTEALLSLPSLQTVKNHKVLIFRGQGGRPTLAEELEKRGAQVDYCELYRRDFPREHALQTLLSSDFCHTAEHQDIVAVHSGEALENWLALQTNLADTAPQQAAYCRDLPVLLPGERVATLAQRTHVKRIIMADNASDDGMLQALLQWRQHTQYS